MMSTKDNSEEAKKLKHDLALEHWFKMKWWRYQEAALLCFGVIPEVEIERGELIVSLSDMISWYEDDSTRILSLLRREFPEDKIAPNIFFKWVLDKNIPLEATVKNLAVQKGLLPKDSNLEELHETNDAQERKENRGAQWKEMRDQIIEAALQVINESELQSKKPIFKANKTIHLENLTESIDTHRARWKFLKDNKQGTSYKNIRDTISLALKNTD